MPNRRSIFLLDGAGALLSAGLLGLVLPALPAWFGMPVPILRVLALGALLLAGYSLLRFAAGEPASPRWLTALIAANLAYCLGSAALVVVHFDALRLGDVAYFGSEIAVILGVVTLERRVRAEWA